MSFVLTPDGVRLRLSDRGQGAAAILLVHGWKQSHRLWDETVAHLETRHRVVSFDLRGMGESDKPNTRYDFDELAGDLAFLIEHLDLRDVTLVGWSMGCTVALHYLRQHRARVARLVMVGGPLRLTRAADFPHTMSEEELEGHLSDLASHWPAEERRFVAESMRNPPAERVDWLFQIALQTPLDVALRTVREQSKLDMRDVITSLPIPVLAIYGRYDPYYPTALADWIAEHAPHGQRVIFEESAHCMPFEEGQRFRSVLESFIAEQNPKSSD